MQIVQPLSSSECFIAIQLSSFLYDLNNFLTVILPEGKASCTFYISQYNL